MAITERQRLLEELDIARNAWVSVHGDVDEMSGGQAEDDYWDSVMPIITKLRRHRAREADWTPEFHPRDRKGQFADKDPGAGLMTPQQRLAARRAAGLMNVKLDDDDPGAGLATPQERLAARRAAGLMKIRSEPELEPEPDVPDDASGEPLGGEQAFERVPDLNDLNIDRKISTSVRHYLENAYIPVNTYLRDGTIGTGGYEERSYSEETVQQMVNEIRDAFNVVPPLSHDIIVHRGMSNADEIFGSVGSRAGQIFDDAAFVSTSTDREVAERFSHGAAFCARSEVCWLVLDWLDS